MKRFLTLIISVVMAFSVFGFSACGGGSSVSGKIDGNYTEVKAENYGEVAAKLDGAKSSVVRNGTAGGTLKAEEEIKLTIGGKSLVLTANEALALILNLDLDQSEDFDLSPVSGASFNLEAELDVDKGFGSAASKLANKLIEANIIGEGDEDSSSQMIAAALSFIDNFDLTVNANAYVKDSKVYTDAQVKGVPDMIKLMLNSLDEENNIDFAALESGVKYVFTQEDIMSIYAMINFMFGNSDSNSDSEEMGLFAADDEEEEESGFSLDIESITAILASMGVKLYTDVAKDGSMKIKIATTADVKTNVNALIKSGLFTQDASEELKAIINSVNFSKLDIEYYLAINANNVITAFATNLDVEVSATVLGTSVELAANGALDCSLAIPDKIDYPSFSAYVSLAA